jgi:hypothetical protein
MTKTGQGALAILAASFMTGAIGTPAAQAQTFNLRYCTHSAVRGTEESPTQDWSGLGGQSLRHYSGRRCIELRSRVQAGQDRQRDGSVQLHRGSGWGKPHSGPAP